MCVLEEFTIIVIIIIIIIIIIINMRKRTNNNYKNNNNTVMMLITMCIKLMLFDLRWVIIHFPVISSNRIILLFFLQISDKYEESISSCSG